MLPVIFRAVYMTYRDIEVRHFFTNRTAASGQAFKRGVRRVLGRLLTPDKPIAFTEPTKAHK
jgi:hypothetical protein